jgi:lipoate-protein ligase B
LSFDVSADLYHSTLMGPCGISDRGVTSLERATGGRLSIADVEDAVVRRFRDIFERRLSDASVHVG